MNMRFKDYCELSEDRDFQLEAIHNSTYKYVRDFLKEQVVSIGKPQKISVDLNKFIVIENQNPALKVDIDVHRHGQYVHLEVYINEQIHENLIDPQYFKDSHIKNYLREFELHAKSILSEIRKRTS